MIDLDVLIELINTCDWTMFYDPIKMTHNITFLKKGTIIMHKVVIEAHEMERETAQVIELMTYALKGLDLKTGKIATSTWFKR